MKRRGEIDFVLVCHYGVFALEVKGGRVSRQGGVWRFTDRYGVAHERHEGPFEQAATAMFALDRDIRDRFRGASLAETLVGYGVLLPDIEFDSTGSEADSSLVYDRRDRHRGFNAYVDRLANFTRSLQSRPRRGLSMDQVLELADFLRGDFDLVPTLDVVVDDTREQLAELTRQQADVLEYLASSPRVVVEGAAGTGKTLLAIEAAKRAARLGKSVLCLCYNKFLATRICSVVDREAYPGRIEVRTVHSHFRRVIDASSLSTEFMDRAEKVDASELFGSLYPEYAALAALEMVKPGYDILIVDEAQDVLSRPNTVALEDWVSGGWANGRWLLFLDSNNQACVYGRMDSSVHMEIRGYGESRILTINCRNTRPIELNTSAISSSEHHAVARIDGPPVEFISYKNGEDCLGKLRAVHASIENDGITPAHVTILFPRIPDARQIALLADLGVTKLDTTDARSVGSPRLTHMTWSPVAGFKGLENDLIVLVGIEDIDSPWWRAVTYVGMSRARTRLFVLIHVDCEAVRSSRLETEIAHRLLLGEMET